MDLGLEPLQQNLQKLGKLPRAYRLAMLPAVVLLVAAVFVYFFYMPVQGKLDRLSNEEMKLRRKLSEVRSVANNEEKVKKEIELLQRRLQAALQQLPDQKELPVLLTDISSLGKNVGLDFEAFRPKEEQKREFYAEVPIEIEFTGRFHDVARFFDEVARLSRIVNVGELNIEIENESASRTVLEVDGRATTFRFLQSGSSGQG